MLKEIYHKSPESVKSIIKKAHSKIPFPYIYGLKFAKYYKWLMKTQWLSQEELEELQNERLRIIINHAYKNVPYYRRIFDERGLKPEDMQCKEDLKLLPILTKDDIRRNFSELVARDFKKYKPILSHTSGSTGTAMDFYLTEFVETVIERASVWMHWNWSNFNYGDKVVTIRGQILTDDLNAVAPYKIQENNLLLSPFHLSERSMSKYSELIINFKPKIIRAYPSAIFLMTKYFKSRELNPPKVTSIITSSETLLPEHRAEIESFWGCKVYDWYGIGERVVAIGECEDGGFHINLDYGIVEFTDINGSNQKEIIATSFWNLAMPLIRYSTKDLVTLSNSNRCSCGKSLPTVKSIDGRIEDFVITKDKRIVGRLDAAFKYSFGIKYSQIIQDEIGHILVKIVRDNNYTDKDKETFMTQGDTHDHENNKVFSYQRLDIELRKRLGDDIDIEYEFVDDIPRTKAGKLRFVVSDVKLEDVL